MLEAVNKFTNYMQYKTSQIKSWQACLIGSANQLEETVDFNSLLVPSVWLLT